MSERASTSKSAEAYRTISEVAEDLGLPQHVLRFWETRFPQVKPLKRAGGRRFYRPEDIELLRAVKTLLYADGYTIKGVQRLLRDQGPKSITALASPSLSTTRDEPADPISLKGGAPTRSATHDSIDVSVSNDPGPPLERSTRDPERLARSDSPPEAAPWPKTDVATDIVGRLEAVLYELVECARLIQQAPDL